MRIVETVRDTSFGTWALRVLIAVAFITTGLFNLTGVLKADQAFAALGSPEAVRVVLGLAQLVGAVLLLIPGAALLGTGVLGLAMLVLVVVRHFAGDTMMELVSLFWLGMIALTGAMAVRREPWRPGRPFFWRIPDRRLPPPTARP